MLVRSNIDKLHQVLIDNKIITGVELYNGSSANTGAALYGNTPNPFKDQTTVNFYIPKETSLASLHIYDLQGKQLKQFAITEQGQTSIIVPSGSLGAGSYIYTLIVDGQEIGSRKMIITD